MITIRQIAQAAGVSDYTVSCALRDQHQVAASTRQRIQELAAAMGYQPDASAVVLAGRRHRKPASRRVCLGLVHTINDERWATGFKEASRVLGYDVVSINQDVFQNPKQASRTIWQRGVDGIVLPLQNETVSPAPLLACEWSRLSVIKISRAIPELRFHLVSHSAFEYANVTLHEVKKRGYKKIAVILYNSEVQEDNDARMGAILNFKEFHTPIDGWVKWKNFPVPVNSQFQENDRLVEAATSWLEKTRPEVIVGFPLYWYYGLKYGKERMLDRVAYASIIQSDTANEPGLIAGCSRNEAVITEICARQLHRMIIQGERGFVKHPTVSYVAPVWVDGTSLPGR